MRRFVRNIVSLFLILAIGSNLSAQDIKREYRISPNDVPSSALAFVKETLTSSRVKWYAEEHEDGKTIEAKGKNGNRAFSIEFDTNGKILDIERDVRFSELAPDLQKKIQTILAKELLRYQLISVQEVQKGMQAELKKAILEPVPQNNPEKNYEFVVRGRTKKGMGFFEFLFDANGNLIDHVEIKK